MLLFIFFFLLWFDLADVDIPVHVVPDGYDRNYFPQLFINHLMFTFKFAGCFIFLKVTNVIFLDELFFLRTQQCSFTLICGVI